MTQNEQKSLLWPLIFRYHGTILGRGFVADIALQGRVLASPESDGVWVYGVNPGAIAISAPTLGDTHGKLRSTLHRLFVDFAEQAENFEDFKVTVERFVDESDPDTQQEWETARASVREGNVPVPGDLPKLTAEAPCLVQVTEKQLDAVTPQDNPVLQKTRDAAVYEAAA